MSIVASTRRKLSSTEKESLRTWILSMESRGCPIRPQMLQVMANILLAKRGDTTTPATIGINWSIVLQTKTFTILMRLDLLLGSLPLQKLYAAVIDQVNQASSNLEIANGSLP